MKEKKPESFRTVWEKKTPEGADARVAGDPKRKLWYFWIDDNISSATSIDLTFEDLLNLREVIDDEIRVVHNIQAEEDVRRNESYGKSRSSRI